MPIFEYRCSSCDRKFEKLVLRKDTAIHCPYCRGGEVQRLISACNFGSSDGSVRSASESSCSGCSATSCSSCKSR